MIVFDYLELFHMPKRVFCCGSVFKSDALDLSNIIRSASEFIGRLRLEENVTGCASRQRYDHNALVTSNANLRCRLQAFDARTDDDRVIGVCQ